MSSSVPVDVQGVASSFVEAFYPTLLSNEWRGLSEFYLPDATFSRTDEEAGVATPTSGVSNIVVELEKIHRKHTNCVPDLAAVTAQEIAPNGNLLVQVVGSFEDQRSRHKSRFAHTFVLLKEVDPATRDCAFFIQNEILVYLAGAAPAQRGAKHEPAAVAQPAPVAAAPAAASPVAAEPAKAPVETKKPVEAKPESPKEEAKLAAKPQQPAKEKKPQQQQQKPKQAAQPKEEKPAAAPAPAKPTSWASIAKTTTAEPSAPAPAPVAVAAAPAKAKVSAPKPAEPAAKPAQAAPKPAAAAAPAEEKVALFVGSLTPKADEASVRRAFSAFGKVKKVDLLPHKNVGFVELDEPRSKLDSILKQIADKPITLDGKQLRVEAREAPKSKGAAGKGHRAPQQQSAQPVDDFAQDSIPSGTLMAE